MIEVTIFPNIENVFTPHFVDVRTVFDRIRNGGNKEQSTLKILEKIWAIDDNDPEKEKKQAELKGQLACICFSGKFSRRNNKDILQHSGLVCLDYDKIPLGEISKVRKKLQDIKYTYACFISPRRNGLKVIIKIPADAALHSEYVLALGKYYPDANYDEFKDRARVCYESYDPDIYINENSHVFDMRKLEKPAVREQVAEEEKITDPQVLYKNVKTWIEKRDEYYDGNKHNFLVAFAGACNRFGLDIDFVYGKMRGDYQYAAEFVADEDFYDIVRRVYITYEEQHGISWMTTKGELSDYDPQGKARDTIYLKDIRDEMIKGFLHGDAKGETTYFKAIDPYFTWRKGEVTLFHGIPNHGKTTVLLHLLLIKTIKEGTKWGIFSPEQNPPVDFYTELIEMYIGKRIDHDNPDNPYRMNMDEFIKGMDFIHEHFFVIYPEKDEPTPQYINDRFEELILKEGIEGCITDPFNQLDNDWASEGGRDDQYISKFLAREKRFALKHDIYKIIVAHPKSGLQMVTDKTKKEFGNEGNYECPGVYHLAGGAMWNNKLDNIIVIYQPYYNTRGKIRNKMEWEEKESEIWEDHQLRLNAVIFRSQKIKKQKLVGKPGSAALFFDPRIARYLEDNFGKDLNSTPFSSEYAFGSDDSSEISTTVDEASWDAFRKKNEEDDKIEHEEKVKRDEDTLRELGIYVEPEKEDENSVEDEVNPENKKNLEGFLDNNKNDDYPFSDEDFGADDAVPF